MLIKDLKQRIANISDDAEVGFCTEAEFGENLMWPIERFVVLTSTEISTGKTTTSVCLM